MKPNVVQAARQAVQSAKQAPMAPQGQPMPSPMAQQAPQGPQTAGMDQQASLPVPPPGVALKLAQQAQSMPPMVLGTLIWRALQQHGAATGQFSPHFHGLPGGVQ